MKENELKQILMDEIKDILFVMKVGDDFGFYYDFINRAALEKTELSMDVIGKSIYEVNTEEVANFLTEKYKRVLQTLTSVTYQDSYNSQHGDISYFETTLTPIVDSTGSKCSYIVTLVHDITEKKRFEHLGVIAEDSQDLITWMDDNGIVIESSLSHKSILGFDQNLYVGKSFLELIHPDDVLSFKEAMSSSLKKKASFKIDIRKKHVSKGWIWFEFKATPIFDHNNKLLYLVCLSSNIQTHIDYELKLKYFAYHDSLTNLPNRRYLKERLAKELENFKEVKMNVLAIVFLDIDYFKCINDKYGHDMGDAVIAEFGNRISRNIRDIDFVARLGGDEFVIMLPNIGSKENVKRFAEKIQTVIRQPWLMKGIKLNITTSMGITIASNKMESISSVLKNADLALYEAKKAGKDSYYIKTN